MKKHKSILTVIILFVLILSSGIQSFALASPMSDTYKNSKFYQRLVSAVKTGYQRADVASVAMSQLGYHEGTSLSDFGGGNTSSSLNFTEYNYHYGSLDGYGYAWCATFVSWCLRQAGVSKETAPSNCNCAAWVARFKDMSRFKASGSYTPKTGDIIFFKARGGDSVSGHVGIVLYVRNNYVYTIEGNTSDAVRQQRYLLSNSTILGYGVPDYPETSSVNGDIYIVSTNDVGSSLALRSEKSTSKGSTLLSLISGQIVEVSETSDGWAKISYGGKEGWASLSYLSLVKKGTSTISDSHTHSYSAKVVSATCVSDGYALYRCSCGNSYKDNITYATGHSYKNGKCIVCQVKDPSYTVPKNDTVKTPISEEKNSVSNNVSAVLPKPQPDNNNEKNNDVLSETEEKKSEESSDNTIMKENIDIASEENSEKQNSEDSSETAVTDEILNSEDENSEETHEMKEENTEIVKEKEIKNYLFTGVFIFVLLLGASISVFIYILRKK